VLLLLLLLVLLLMCCCWSCTARELTRAEREVVEVVFKQKLAFGHSPWLSRSEREVVETASEERKAS
jgi:hypothetical protein